MNRIMLSKWKNLGPEPILTLLWPFMENSAGSDENDQRASIVFDYLFSGAGLNIYLEWARNDFSPGLDYVIRYPFHTAAYTFGIKKGLAISRFFQGEILLEVTNLGASQDYDRLIAGTTSFYVHHIITQGHTNEGQWLGAGIGTGGNSQYVGFKLYFPNGYGQVFFQRRNPDLDYTWYIDKNKYPANGFSYIAEQNIRAFLDFGISALYWITQSLSAVTFIVLRDEHNPLNESEVLSDPQSSKSVHRYNCYISLGLRYYF
jgi:hypothetical protein